MKAADVKELRELRVENVLLKKLLAKVRSGDPLTQDDIDDLQRVPVAVGIGDDATFAEASQRSAASGCSSARW